jgi:hypothetical protein
MKECGKRKMLPRETQDWQRKKRRQLNVTRKLKSRWRKSNETLKRLRMKLEYGILVIEAEEELVTVLAAGVARCAIDTKGRTAVVQQRTAVMQGFVLHHHREIQRSIYRRRAIAGNAIEDLLVERTRRLVQSLRWKVVV